MSAFLTAEEVFVLTRYRRYTAQCRELTRLGIRFRTARDGSPVVRHVDLDERKGAARNRTPRWELIGT